MRLITWLLHPFIRRDPWVLIVISSLDEINKRLASLEAERKDRMH